MFDIQIYGDRGLRIQLGTTISQATNEKIRSLCALLEKEKIAGIVEWIPAYIALSIYYDPEKITFDELSERIRNLYENLSEIVISPAELITIPVCYGGEWGPDLSIVAKHNGITEGEVINIHSESNYLIYMMGFSPGFPYLGGMSEKIATPRLATPRTNLPGGSVGIAGTQTGVYPSESPGGWQLIGRTPLKLYNPEADPPILLRAGNYIRFHPISEGEYEAVSRAVRENTYQPLIKPMEGERDE